MKTIQTNSTVSVHYTGKLEDGTIFDSSLGEGRQALKATLGQGQLIPGFEQGLVGMTVGEKKTVEIAPENAYGPVNEQMIFEVERERVPADVQVNAMLQGNTPNGPVNFRVAQVNEGTVTLDANHPLAGQKLIFELEVVEVL